MEKLQGVSREKTKDTPESVPIRHRDQVLVLLEQVIRDRTFGRTTVVLEEPVFHSKHKSVGHPFRILPQWYQELKDRYLEVIKLPGFEGNMVTCFDVQMYGERMNLTDTESMMYTPSVDWACWFMRIQMNLCLWKVYDTPVVPDDREKQDKLYHITLQRLTVHIADGLDPKYNFVSDQFGMHIFPQVRW